MIPSIFGLFFYSSVTDHRLLEKKNVSLANTTGKPGIYFYLLANCRQSDDFIAALATHWWPSPVSAICSGCCFLI